MSRELPISALVNYRRDFLFDNGYMYCEHCGRSDGYYYEVHHIFYRSEKPNHSNLHHYDNLILVCKKCHLWLHEQKNRRESLNKYKESKELFYGKGK